MRILRALMRSRHRLLVSVPLRQLCSLGRDGLALSTRVAQRHDGDGLALSTRVAQRHVGDGLALSTRVAQRYDGDGLALSTRVAQRHIWPGAAEAWCCDNRISALASLKVWTHTHH